jgi:thiol-disulfide isomerase/thioredoxin
MSINKTVYRPDFSTWQNWITLITPDIPESLTIIHVWSKSCPACHENMPHVQKLKKEYAEKGLQVIGVHRPMRELDMDVDEVRKVAAELGVTEPCALDNDHKIGDALGVDAWPTYFLFDETGKLRRRAKGNFGVRMIEQALIRMYGEDEKDEKEEE